MTVQHLGGMTWREVKAFVHERVVAFVPLGSLQAHGPHLPINSDVVIASEAVRRAVKNLAQKGMDLLVYPPVVFSPAPLASRFSGTVSLSRETFGAVLMNILDEIRTLGVRTVCLVTIHTDPANLEVIRQVVAEYAHDDRLRVLFPDFTQEPWLSRMPEEFRKGGSHAGRFETAAIMVLQEDKVREEIRKRLVRVETNLDHAVREGKTHYAECGSLQGYFGDPAAAAPADGEQYLDILGGIVADIVTLGRA